VTPQTVAIDLGTVGGFDGITQFAGSSTAVAREQDGYGAGSLTSVSIDKGGVLVGAFSNGTKRDIATMALALFNNDSGLLGIGGGYFIPSPNSGDPVIGEALTGGAGATIGGALEKSNADVATEFVTLIQAQNGYQANARTIRVANEVLQELANLIR
jgi:flagellar hook protein FlgE